VAKDVAGEGSFSFPSLLATHMIDGEDESKHLEEVLVEYSTE
jgi:hypothetical protein